MSDHAEELSELRKFVAPEFVFGAGARRLAGRYAKNLGARKVLVVTDAGVISAGWPREVIASLDAEGIAHAVFSQVSDNPRAEEVMAGARVYQEEACNAIVAVGGGSPMDCAKGIGIVSSNHKPVTEFEGVDEVPAPGPPLLCVPTTAGSSADVSQFAVITDVKRKAKIAIASKSLVPDAALIDPVTTTTMDAYLTACTGMDALAHAIEAYVSTAQSAITDLFALEAIRMAAGALADAIREPRDLGARRTLMLASLYAGLAFSNGGLGAVHAMAHALGGLLDFAHGESNALLLESVIEYNYNSAPERYRRIGQALGAKGGNAAGLAAALAGLRAEIGLVRTLGELGVRSDAIPELAQKAMRDICMVTNPRPPVAKEIEDIYAKAV